MRGWTEQSKKSLGVWGCAAPFGGSDYTSVLTPLTQLTLFLLSLFLRGKKEGEKEEYANGRQYCRDRQGRSIRFNLRPTPARLIISAWIPISAVRGRH